MPSMKYLVAWGCAKSEDGKEDSVSLLGIFGTWSESGSNSKVP